MMDDFTAKLADFGLARKLAHSMTAFQGTVRWMAPEILSNGRYSTKADIYSFGLIAWEVFEQKTFFQEFPFDSMIEIEVVSKGTRPPFTEATPPQAAAIIVQCWDADPSKRPTAAELVTLLSNLPDSTD